MSYSESQFQDEPIDDDADEEIIIDPSSEYTGPIDGLDELKEREEKEARRAARRRARRRERDLRTGLIALACICVCLIIAAIITVSVLKSVERYVVYGSTGPAPTHSPVTAAPVPTAPPTPAPTYAGGTTIRTRAPEPTMAPPTPAPIPPSAAPTNSPTAQPTPRPTMPLQESYTFEPFADTYLYVDGPDLTKFYGSEESFLVQLGTKVEKPGVALERATAKAILAFDTSILPDRSRWPNPDGSNTLPVNATLELHHIAFKDRDDLQNQPNVDLESRSSVTMEVFRLPSTINPDLKIEAYTGAAFIAAPWTERTGYLVTALEIGPDDGWITIDLKKAIFIPDSVNSEDYTDDKFIFLLSVSPGNSAGGNSGAAQASVIGDRFHSREASDDGFGPKLTISNFVV